MTVSRFRIAAMDCAAEEQLVRMALADLDAIDHLHFDLKQREVFIDHQTDPTIIDSALQRLNLGARHLDDNSEIQDPCDSGSSERNALSFALVINAGFFIGELTIGLISRSMGLVADALDMGADASVYALSLAAVGSATARKKQLAREAVVGGFDHSAKRSGREVFDQDRTSIADDQWPNRVVLGQAATVAGHGDLEVEVSGVEVGGQTRDGLGDGQVAGVTNVGKEGSRRAVNADGQIGRGAF